MPRRFPGVQKPHQRRNQELKYTQGQPNTVISRHLVGSVQDGYGNCDSHAADRVTEALVNAIGCRYRIGWNVQQSRAIELASEHTHAQTK